MKSITKKKLAYLTITLILFLVPIISYFMVQVLLNFTYIHELIIQRINYQLEEPLDHKVIFADSAIAEIDYEKRSIYQLNSINEVIYERLLLPGNDFININSEGWFRTEYTNEVKELKSFRDNSLYLLNQSYDSSKAYDGIQFEFSNVHFCKYLNGLCFSIDYTIEGTDLKYTLEFDSNFNLVSEKTNIGVTRVIYEDVDIQVPNKFIDLDKQEFDQLLLSRFQLETESLN